MNALSEEKIAAISSSKSKKSLDLKYYPEVDITDYYFISYSHKDYKEVYKDLVALEELGLKFWFDRDIPVGNNWKEVANKFMRPILCKGVIFYISENSLRDKKATENTMAELAYAKEVGKPIIAINLQTTVKDNDGKKRKVIFSGEELVNYLIKNGRGDLIKHKKEIVEVFPKEVIYLSIDDIPSFKKNKIESAKNQPKLLFDGEVITSVTDSTIINITKEEFHTMLVNNGYAFDTEETFTNFIINQCAFANCQSLESVTLDSDSYQIVLDCISDFAFSNCTSLKELNFGCTNFLYLGSGVFSNCVKLKSLPRPVSIFGGMKVFANCTSLKEVVAVDGSAFGSHCFYNCTSLERVRRLNVETPTNEVTYYKIGDYAFYNCVALRDVFIPFNTVEIGENAFENCVSLEMLVIPEQIVKVGDYAFKNCTKLNVVGIASDDIDIDLPRAFLGCDFLQSVIFGENNKTYKVINKAVYKDHILQFYPPYELQESLVIDEDCVGIRLSAIINNQFLKEIVFGKTAKCEEFTTFNCPNLERIVVSEDNQYLKAVGGVLYSKDLKRLIFVPRGTAKNDTFKIPEGVETIDECALQDIRDIKKVIFPKSLKSIDFPFKATWKEVVISNALKNDLLDLLVDESLKITSND